MRFWIPVLDWLLTPWRRYNDRIRKEAFEQAKREVLYHKKFNELDDKEDKLIQVEQRINKKEKKLRKRRRKVRDLQKQTDKKAKSRRAKAALNAHFKALHSKRKITPEHEQALGKMSTTGLECIVFEAHNLIREYHNKSMFEDGFEHYRNLHIGHGVAILAEQIIQKKKFAESSMKRIIEKKQQKEEVESKKNHNPGMLDIINYGQ